MWHVTCDMQNCSLPLQHYIGEGQFMREVQNIYDFFLMEFFGFLILLDFLNFFWIFWIFFDLWFSSIFFMIFFWVSGFLDFFGIFFRFLHCFRIFLDFLCLHLAFIFGVLTFGLWIYIAPLTSPERGRGVALNGPIKGPRW